MNDLIVDALATFRLTRLLMSDEITETPRNALQQWAIGNTQGRPGDLEHPKLYAFLGCPWCISVYVAAGVLAARHFRPREWDVLAKGLVYSAAAGIIATKLET